MNRAWRRAAIEKIPRLRQLVDESDRIGLLWVELWHKFVRAHSDPIDEELIGQIYDYAWWGANTPDPAMRDVAILSFYEDLPTDPKVREQMAKWLSAEVFSGMGEIFRYHLRSYVDYKEFVGEFYEQRERLGDAAAKNDAWHLTDEEIRAQVSEAVSSLQEGQQKRRELGFEYLARIYVVDNPEVLEHLAPALQQCKRDALAIATAITPILLSLVASGAVSFPAHADTFAAAAVLLAER
jgi:hypothetical protein